MRHRMRLLPCFGDLPSSLAVGLTATLLGCGGQGEDAPATTVAFPQDRQEQAAHCAVLLQLRVGQIEEMTGGGTIGRYVGRRASEDFATALPVALEETEPPMALGPVDEIAAMIRETVGRFDHDSDGNVTKRGEIEEFNRHVDRCVVEFGSSGG